MKKWILIISLFLIMIAGQAFGWDSMDWNKQRKTATKTLADTTLTIGTGASYVTFAAAMAALPGTLQHNITMELAKGTTLTETLELQNVRLTAGDLTFSINAATYYPTTGALPTASAASATSLTDTGMTWTVDAYNGCWVFIVDGTGTDNGFVAITDTAADTLTVAAWPGTEPDATSVYVILGALIDTGARNYGADLQNSDRIYWRGIGFLGGSTGCGVHQVSSRDINYYYCGFYNQDWSGLSSAKSTWLAQYCGFVACNQESGAEYGGIKAINDYGSLYNSYLSDNDTQGIYASAGSSLIFSDCGGDGNGAYGLFIKDDSGAKYILISGSLPSGSTGTTNYTALDADLTSLSAGITGLVLGAGDGGGYSAAVGGTDYLAPIMSTPAADDTWSGVKRLVMGGEDIDIGELVYHQIGTVYWYLYDADGANKTDTQLGFAVSECASCDGDGSSDDFYITVGEGMFRHDAWAWTIATDEGKAVYADDLVPGGLIIDTADLDAGDTVIKVGYMETANAASINTLHVKISADYGVK